MGRRRKSKTGTSATTPSDPPECSDGRVDGDASVTGADASVRVVPSQDHEEEEQTRSEPSPRRVYHSSSDSGGYDSLEDARCDELYVPPRFQPSGRSFGTRDHYAFWCRSHKKYVELLYDTAEPFVNSLKGPGGRNPTINDFYAFAFNNSSGYISPYL